MSRKILKIEEIKEIVEQIAKEFNLIKVSLFGSYASGKQTPSSDIDLLVEFTTESVSLFDLIDLQLKLEELTRKRVDVVHAPIPKTSIIEVEKEILLYAA